MTTPHANPRGPRQPCDRSSGGYLLSQECHGPMVRVPDDPVQNIKKQNLQGPLDGVLCDLSFTACIQVLITDIGCVRNITIKRKHVFPTRGNSRGHDSHGIRRRRLRGHRHRRRSSHAGPRQHNNVPQQDDHLPALRRSPPAPRLTASLVVRSNIVLVCSGEAPHFTCPASAPCIASNDFVDLEVRGCSLYGGAGIHVNGSRSLSLRNVTVDKCRYTRTTLTPPTWGHSSPDSYIRLFSAFSCVFVENTTSLEIVGSTLSDGLQTATTYVPGGPLGIMQADAMGGCLSVVRTSSVNIIRSNITMCTLGTLSSYGGCISFRQCGTVYINDTDISGCTANNDMYSTIAYNLYPRSGGGIGAAQVGKMLIHRSTIRGATSTDGGCMHVHYSGEVTISDSLLTNCTALLGGGISSFSLSKLQVINSTISNSKSTSKGGCIHSNKVQEVALLNATLSMCLSEGVGAGAATWISSAKTVLIIGTIIENATAPGGNSLYQLLGNATIINTSILGQRNSIQMEQVSLTMSNTIMRSLDPEPCLLLSQGISRVEASDLSTCSVAFFSVDADVSYIPSATDKTTWAVYNTSWNVTGFSRMGMMIRQPMRVPQSYGACVAYLYGQNVSQVSVPVINDEGYARCRSRSGTELCPFLNGSVPVNRTVRRCRRHRHTARRPSAF